LSRICDTKWKNAAFGRHFLCEKASFPGFRDLHSLNDVALLTIVCTQPVRCAVVRRILMNKNELVSAVAEKAGLSKAQATEAVDAVFTSIEGALSGGDDLRLVGFGTFSVSRREASKGRNPSTGAEVDIPARNVPKFTPGKGLKDAVNNR